MAAAALTSVGAVLVAVGPIEKRLNAGAALVVVGAGVNENVGALVVGFGRPKPNEVPALLVAVVPPKVNVGATLVVVAAG